MKLAEKLLDLRKRNGLSQEELAAKLNISRQAVSRWEGGTAQPDASNILQLSKLFHVTADYLLNDEYESDEDIPAVQETQASAKRNIRKVIAVCIAAIGLFGNFTFYLLSRFIEVPIPHITYENGRMLYTWNGYTGHSYGYFIQEYSLEFLTILFWGIVIVGVGYLLLHSALFRKAAEKFKRKAAR